MTAAELFFLTEGRIGRGAYWRGVIAIAILSWLSALTLGAIFGPSLYFSAGGRFAVFALTMLWLYPAYCVAAKRFQDQNESAVFALIGPGVTVLKAGLILFAVELHDPWHPQALVRLLLYVQVLVGIFYFIALGCMRGTTCPNRYGPGAGARLTARRPVRIARLGQLQTSS